MKHTCHAFRCSRNIPPRQFMCGKHWSMVPTELRDEIWSLYVPGQERGKVWPTREYIAAARRAQDNVAKQEGMRE